MPPDGFGVVVFVTRCRTLSLVGFYPRTSPTRNGTAAGYGSGLSTLARCPLVVVRRSADVAANLRKPFARAARRQRAVYARTLVGCEPS